MDDWASSALGSKLISNWYNSKNESTQKAIKRTILGFFLFLLVIFLFFLLSNGYIDALLVLFGLISFYAFGEFFLERLSQKNQGISLSIFLIIFGLILLTVGLLNELPVLQIIIPVSFFLGLSILNNIRLIMYNPNKKASSIRFVRWWNGYHYQFTADIFNFIAGMTTTLVVIVVGLIIVLFDFGLLRFFGGIMAFGGLLLGTMMLIMFTNKKG